MGMNAPLFQDGFRITNIRECLLLLLLDGFISNLPVVKNTGSGLVKEDASEEIKLRSAAEVTTATMVSGEHHAPDAGQGSLAHT